MWARISEIILGLWLLTSHFIFSTNTWVDIGSALLILLFAGLSYIDRLNKIHLSQVLPAGLLLYAAYIYPTPWLPIFMQNYIIIALCLLMFCIIPSNASDHPRPWKKFLQGK